MSLLTKIRVPRYYWIAASGWLSRAVTAVAKVAVIPLVLNYLGTNLYAAFVIVVGLEAWFQLVDCGIGDSLQNAISERQALGEDTFALYCNATILIFGVTLLLFIPFCLLAYPLQILLFHKLVGGSVVWYLLLVIGLIYIAKTTLGISYRVFFAEHRGQWSYLYQALGPVIAVIATLFVRELYHGESKLFMVLLAWTIPMLFFTAVCYWQAFPWSKVWRYYDYQLVKSLFLRGLNFWGFYFGTMCVLAMDYIIMSQTLNAKEITIYSILARGFNIIFFIYQAVLQVIWPQLTELYIKHKWSIADRLLYRNIGIGILVVLVATVAAIMARHLVIAVLAPGKSLVLPISAIVLFGCYYLVRVWSDSFAVAVKSQNYLRVFWVYLPIQAVISVLTMYFGSLYFGLNGIIMGLLLSFFVTAAWILPCVSCRLRQGRGAT